MNQKTIPRGFRNNNPCNIRKGGNWQGLDTPPDDGEFCRFTSLAYGFRAALKLLRTYYNKYGLRTVDSIIRRWAPESENNTAYYIRIVATSAKVTPKMYLPDFAIAKTMWVNILVTMAQVENGVDTYDESYLKLKATEGYEMLYPDVEN